MPNFKYSGSKGIVQSTGAGQFHVSGVGIAQDEEEIAINGTANARAYGVTKLTNVTNASVLTIPKPVQVEDAAGQQKLVVVSGIAGGGNLTVRSQTTNDLIGATLTAANDYALLVWTGSDWTCIAQVST